MIVSELIDILSKCNPIATVCVEACYTNKASSVKSFINIRTQKEYVYIADNLDYIVNDCEEVDSDLKEI